MIVDAMSAAIQSKLRGSTRYVRSPTLHPPETPAPAWTIGRPVLSKTRIVGSNTARNPGGHSTSRRSWPLWSHATCGSLGFPVKVQPSRSVIAHAVPPCGP